MANSVIIVAGGSGKRFGADIPKQFLVLDGRPVLMHTIEAFFKVDPTLNIILVLPKEHFNLWEELSEKHNFTLPHHCIEGGKERFFSVKAAVPYCSNSQWVAVHDGVRPLVSEQTIRTGVLEVTKKGNAIPVIALNDSLRKISPDGSTPQVRNDFRLVQTPQFFSAKLLRDMYTLDYDPEFTDDASVAEALGTKINLYPGNPENIKITNPSDLIMAEALLKRSLQS